MNTLIEIDFKEELKAALFKAAIGVLFLVGLTIGIIWFEFVVIFKDLL